MEHPLPLFSDVLLALAEDRAREGLTDLEALIRASPTCLSYPPSPTPDRGFFGHLHPRGRPFGPLSEVDPANQVVGPLLDLPPPPPYSAIRLTCRWIDCQGHYPDQEALVRHIERAHVEQRPGVDFTCLWQGCPRRQRPFNARYKLRKIALLLGGSGRPRPTQIHIRAPSFSPSGADDKENYPGTEREWTCERSVASWLHVCCIKPKLRCKFTGCPKAFSRLENLKIHSRSHTGERPYRCQHNGCPKAFSNSSDRAKHQRTHVDTKPYACQIIGCNKRYTDPSSLRKHVKHHREIPLRKKERRETESADQSPFSRLDCVGADSEMEQSSEGDVDASQSFPDMISPADPQLIAGGQCANFLDHPPDPLFSDMHSTELFQSDTQAPPDDNICLRVREWSKGSPDNWPLRLEEEFSLDMVHRMLTTHLQGFQTDASWSTTSLIGSDDPLLRCPLIFADGLGP